METTPIEELIRVAEMTHGLIGLGYTVEALERLEEIIRDTQEDVGSVKMKDHHGLSTATFCFLGQCLVVNYKGEWRVHEKYDYCIYFGKKTEFYPVNKVRRFFENGDEDSIVGAYKAMGVILKQEGLL